MTQVFVQAQNAGRLESEYKLAIPTEYEELIWDYLKTEYDKADFNVDGLKLTGKHSEEDFIDVYFDDEKGSLEKQQVGLRYRSRYKDGILLKKLIQLKTPLEADGVIRNEIKYNINEKPSVKDFLVRHPFLKYVKPNDRESLNFYLASFNVRAEHLFPKVKLRQTRKRIYITDSIGSIATITLDFVTNSVFPFQNYVEMELELNEVRYTQANDIGKREMDAFNQSLKGNLIKQFPKLVQDQTPKYNKMLNLINKNPLSFIYENSMWIIFGIIILAGLYSFIRMT